jgi:cation-transporting ATPase 13A1
MLVAFESTVVHQRLRNLNDVRGLQRPKAALQVYRAGKWARLPGEQLLPGDLVSLIRSGELVLLGGTGTWADDCLGLVTAWSLARGAPRAACCVAP